MCVCERERARVSVSVSVNVKNVYLPVRTGKVVYV